MIFHRGSGRVVLFGGDTTTRISTEIGDQWEWDGTDWIQLSPGSAPFARYNAGVAYDSARDRVLVAGGAQTDAMFGDTWAWDGAQWTELDPGRQPIGRTSPVVWFDPVRARVMLFGGRFSQLLGDTWEWDGSRWSKLRLAAAPSLLRFYVGTYDQARQRLVLVSVGLGGVGETWEWDGVSWRQIPSTAPAPAPVAMAFDPNRRRVVALDRSDMWEWDGTDWLAVAPATFPAGYVMRAMAADTSRERVVLLSSGTWEWDGMDWQLRAPQTQSPPLCCRPAMVYDRARQRTVAFGVVSIAYGSGTQTWEWDGTAWEQRAATLPGIPQGHSMAYDPRRRRVTLFGGWGSSSPPTYLADTWEYGPDAPALYSEFGAGCAGTAGTPTLGVPPVGLPWVGATLRVELSSLPPRNAAAMLVGASATRWGAVSLPLPLAGAGMPGCSLWVSPDHAVPLANPYGTATWSASVCACPSLVGTQLYNQGVVVDPTANPTGVVASSAGAARFGAK
ncbi:MAG: hypothetical protein AAF628_37355 [Planctomycetota bacterium]